MTVCAWCSRRTENGRATGDTIPKPHPIGTTHGICVDCAEKFEAMYERHEPRTSTSTERASR